MLRSGAWTGGPGNHQSIGGGTLPSIWKMEDAERTGSWWGPGLSPGLSPFGAFFEEVLLRSTKVVSLGYRPQLGGALPESCNQVMVSFIFFTLFSNVLITVYRHG
jgi:hypothetical protein